MADVHDIATRSFNMSRIKGKNTQPEMLVRRYLHAQGFRYRLHVKGLPGKPDIVLAKFQAVIFVNGCFWHGHPECKKAALPKTRAEWWKSKIERNSQNDTKHYQQLRQLGWQVIIIWSCKLKPKNSEETLQGIINALSELGKKSIQSK